MNDASKGSGGASTDVEGKRLPVAFLNHGGGPLPIIEESGGAHHSLVESLRNFQEDTGVTGKVRAILVISAHWEEKTPHIAAPGGENLMYDYYGFPPIAYTLQYPCRGATDVARRTMELLKKAGMTASVSDRNFDHGVFVPLLLAYPDADVPVLQLSCLQSHNIHDHIEMGRILRPLRSEGVLILGSGMSTHNMKVLMTGIGHGSISDDSAEKLRNFDDWLVSACVSRTGGDRERTLSEFSKAPFGRFAHPNIDHLLPLFVCIGAAGASTGRATLRTTFVGASISNFLFDDREMMDSWDVIDPSSA